MAGRRDGSVVTNTCCSCGELVGLPEPTSGSSKPPVTPAPGSWHLFWPPGYLCMCAHTNMHTHTWIKWNLLNKRGSPENKHLHGQRDSTWSLKAAPVSWGMMAHTFDASIQEIDGVDLCGFKASLELFYIGGNLTQQQRTAFVTSRTSHYLGFIFI